MVCFIAVLMLVSCAGGRWTAAEKDLLGGQSDIMRVLSVFNPADSVVLHKQSADIPVRALSSAEYQALARKMLATVVSPGQEGVGIAAPQVGISRRVVAVQRFDKPGEPFEVYPNVRVINHRGEREYGAEGCLSVPGLRGNVLRWRDIDVQYTSFKTLRDTVETVTGFTSVIFQHECDHLDGILYTEYADTHMQ